VEGVGGLKKRGRRVVEREPSREMRKTGPVLLQGRDLGEDSVRHTR